MLTSRSIIAGALALTASVNAHGFLKYVDYNGVSYGLWQPFNDPYLSPRPYRYDRWFLDNGPVNDMTSGNITCNNGPNDPTGVGSIEVKAGDTLYVQWPKILQMIPSIVQIFIPHITYH